MNYSDTEKDDIPNPVQREVARAMMNFAIIALMCYRADEKEQYLDALEESAKELETALADNSVWIQSMFISPEKESNK